MNGPSAFYASSVSNAPVKGTKHQEEEDKWTRNITPSKKDDAKDAIRLAVRQLEAIKEAFHQLNVLVKEVDESRSWAHMREVNQILQAFQFEARVGEFVLPVKFLQYRNECIEEHDVLDALNKALNQARMLPDRIYQVTEIRQPAWGDRSDDRSDEEKEIDRVSRIISNNIDIPFIDGKDLGLIANYLHKAIVNHFKRLRPSPALSNIWEQHFDTPDQEVKNSKNHQDEQPISEMQGDWLTDDSLDAAIAAASCGWISWDEIAESDYVLPKTIFHVALDSKKSLQFVAERLTILSKTAKLITPESDKLFLDLADGYFLQSEGVRFHLEYEAKGLASLFGQTVEHMKQRYAQLKEDSNYKETDNVKDACHAIGCLSSIESNLDRTKKTQHLKRATAEAICTCQDCLDRTANANCNDLLNNVSKTAGWSWEDGWPTNDEDTSDSNTGAGWSTPGSEAAECPLCFGNSNCSCEAFRDEDFVVEDFREDFIAQTEDQIRNQATSFFDPRPLTELGSEWRCLAEDFSATNVSNGQSEDGAKTGWNRVQPNVFAKTYCKNCGEVNWVDEEACCDCGKLLSETESLSSRSSEETNKTRTDQDENVESFFGPAVIVSGSQWAEPVVPRPSAWTLNAQMNGGTAANQSQTVTRHKRSNAVTQFFNTAGSSTGKVAGG